MHRSVHVQRIGVQDLFNLSVVEIEIALDMRSLERDTARHRRLSTLSGVGAKYDGSSDFQAGRIQNAINADADQVQVFGHLCANQANIVEG